jgi:glutaredoxin
MATNLVRIVPQRDCSWLATGAKLTEMVTRSGQHSVPQIFVDDVFVDECKERCALTDSGALDKRLAGNVVRKL